MGVFFRVLCLTGKDIRIFVNGDIRKAIGKGGGAEVVFTMNRTGSKSRSKKSLI